MARDADWSRGCLHVYTGDGKGKTTAALGVALRAAGAGLDVLFAQFIKGGQYSEIEALERYGDRIAVLGGIDVDFICRASVDQIRKRVRHTLAQCMPGGGYCLGTGNSVANYIPLDNYLAMLDEGRKFKL